MKIIYGLVLIFIVLGCGLSPEDKLAKESMEGELRKEFVIPNDSSLFENSLVPDIILSNSIWTNPLEIDSVSILTFSSLEKYYQHDMNILGLVYEFDDLVGHYNFPKINKDSYLPDTIIDSYNKFSTLYNSSDPTLIMSTDYIHTLQEYFKQYVESNPPPHFGFTNRAKVLVRVSGENEMVEWTNQFDLNRKFEYYQND